MSDKRPIDSPAPPSSSFRLETFLTEKRLAERHQISVKSIRNARVYGGYVKFVKIGRSVRYRLSDVIEFEEAHLRTSTSASDCGQAPRGRSGDD
jgi:hypothetical protein